MLFSHCAEHTWELHKFNPSKHSIFALGEAEVKEDDDAEEQEAAYDQLEMPADESAPPSTPTLCERAVCSSEQKSIHLSQNLKLGRLFVVCGGNARAL